MFDFVVTNLDLYVVVFENDWVWVLSYYDCFGDSMILYWYLDSVMVILLAFDWWFVYGGCSVDVLLLVGEVCWFDV